MIIIIFTKNDKVKIINKYDSDELNIWKNIEEFPKNEANYVYLGILNNTCNNKDNCFMLTDNKKEQSFNKNSIKINFSCLEDEYSECSKSKIIIDNNIEYQMFDVFEYDFDSILILKTKEIYVIKEIGGQYGEGIISIYDKNGELLLDIDEVITSFNLLENDKIDFDKTYSYIPVINDNKLYYVFRSDEVAYSEGVDSKIEFGYIDLETLKYTKLYSTPAITYIIP